MVRKYVLPCAGYDRPGGKVSRAVAEELAKNRDDVIIGSIGALFKERPGEMRDFRVSEIYCLDGCGTNCASELVRLRGREDATIFSIPEIVGKIKNFEEKVKHLIEVVTTELDKGTQKTSSTVAIEDSSEIEYLEARIDKFKLKVAKGMKYSDNDFWVKVEGELVRVGATDFLQQMMSDVYFVELEEPGIHVDMFDDGGSMESTKILVEIIVPISGTIVESNKLLETKPELINESPYEKGWLYLIRPDNLEELELLKDANEYLEYAIAKAQDEIGKKVE